MSRAKRFKRFSICFVALLVPAAAIWSQDKPQTNRESELVIPKNCRVRLIDRVTLASDRPGVVDFVEPREGDVVELGAKVAALRADVARAALAVAQKKTENDIEIRFSKKAAELADVEHQKALDTNRNVGKTIPDIEVRRLKLAAEKGALQIEQADHDHSLAKLALEQARAELDAHEVFAPFGGLVTKVHKLKGEAVRQGDPILDLVSTDRVRIEGDIDLSQVWQIRRGDPVTVRLDVPDYELNEERLTFSGKVVFIDVLVNPVSGLVRIWAECENKDNILRDGLTTHMTIVPHSAAPPRTASKRK